jgi:hypothetical protein
MRAADLSARELETCISVISEVSICAKEGYIYETTPLTVPVDAAAVGGGSVFVLPHVSRSFY